MEFRPEVKDALLKINFVERAKKLTADHFADSDSTFESYDNEEIIKILDELGYKAKYNKEENFFKIVEKVLAYKFYFHISLKYGTVELIWYVDKEDEFYGGSVWSMMKRILEGNDEMLMQPEFHNYEELEEILKEAFLMYEDFKNELCSISEIQH